MATDAETSMTITELCDNSNVFMYCYDVGGYWGIKNSHYNFILNTRQFDGICYCKVKNSGDCRNGCETFSANWQNMRKTFGGYQQKHYICAIYQRLWRKILYCSSVRCTTDCSNGRGSGTENPQFSYKEQDESESPHLQKSLLEMSMSPTFSSTLPLHRQKCRSFLMIYQTWTIYFFGCNLSIGCSWLNASR